MAAFPGFFVPSIVDWGVLGLAGILSLAGHLRLLRAWAGQRGQLRGLIWLLLLSGAGAASALIAALPLTLAGRPAGFLATWAALAATLLLGLALLAPLKRLVDRLVFPGGRITDADISHWRDQLADATGEKELIVAANAILRQRID